MNIQEAMARYLPLIEGALREALQTPHAHLAAHHGMMHYHLGWVDERFQPKPARGGKRLRPLLCLLACEAAGGDVHDALPAAAAIEILHNFSLVHDDIEDNSPTRRGRPAVWALWGVPQAVNVGDALFALAHRTLGRLWERDMPAERVLAAILAFDEACVALTEGQYLDMSFEERSDVTVDEYLRMIDHVPQLQRQRRREIGELGDALADHPVAENDVPQETPLIGGHDLQPRKTKFRHSSRVVQQDARR